MLNQTDMDRCLLAAVRRASHDEQIVFDEPPRPVNATGSVFVVEPRTPSGTLSGTAVLRLCPDLEVARREAIVHQFLTDRGFPAPAVLLTGSADDELGGAWLLTEHVAGPAARARGWRSPMAAMRSLMALWRRPALLADLSARLHSIEPGLLSAALQEAAVDFDWYRFQWDLAQQFGGAGQSEVIDWLKAHRPVDSEAVVSHGDLHPGNVVVSPDGPEVVDWGIAALAPAARDVAATMFALCNTGGQAPAPARPVFLRLGTLLSRRFLRLSCRRSVASMTGDELDWHRVLYSVNRMSWLTNEEGRGPAANHDDVLAGARHTTDSLRQERRLNAGIIRDVTGIEIEL